MSFVSCEITTKEIGLFLTELKKQTDKVSLRRLILERNQALVKDKRNNPLLKENLKALNSWKILADV